MRSVRLRATLLISMLTACSAVAMGAAAAPASADTPTGWLRVAHLSPDTADVDVYLTPFSGGDRVVLRSVGYGDVSTYRKVPVGDYTASMWPAGATTTGTPVLSGKATVTAGHAYTVAAFGRKADISAAVLTDDLSRPSAGSGRVRIIQAATQASKVTITADGGRVLSAGTGFGATSAYQTVAAQPWTLHVAPSGGAAKPLVTTVDVSAGVVTTLLVLDGSQGKLQVRSIVDSRGASTTPRGGVNTGYGPSQQRSNFGLYWFVGLALCAFTVVLNRLRTPVYAPRHARSSTA